jgi:RimJ/RimL family protein N-acetyltransferase
VFQSETCRGHIDAGQCRTDAANKQQAGRAVIVVGGHFVVVQLGLAEVAFAAVDEYQGQGICAALMHHLIAHARDAGLKELIAEVLTQNVPMLRVFEKCGLSLKTNRVAGVVHVVPQL